MKATGIIVEYNPFHNGHHFHITEAKKKTNADLIIAVMSGNFLQRGEPALIDKWARTKMALANGVDLVFELPYAFATAHAPLFAKGAIQLLDAAHCQAFCFGSEEGSISPFENSLALLKTTKTEQEATIKEAVSRGLSYPKALNEAYIAAAQSATPKKTYADLTQPNNILGFHYVQAAADIHSAMRPTTVQRIGAHYHDETISGNRIASATGIRKALFATESLEDVHSYLPDKTSEELVNWQSTYSSFGSWEAFYPFLRGTILRDGPERLHAIADVTEGIENLFYRAAMNHETFSGFMQAVKSKRYTWTRIQRMLTHIYTGFTSDRRRQIEAPSYLRLLGMTQTGRLYLNEHKKRFQLPLISKVSAFSDASLELDIHAANMYALGIDKETAQLGSDYRNAPIFNR